MTSENGIDLSRINLAMQKELLENPFCPVVIDLFVPLLERILAGDPKAFELASEIAESSLKPHVPLFSSIRRRLFPRY